MDNKVTRTSSLEEENTQIFVLKNNNNLNANNNHVEISGGALIAPRSLPPALYRGGPHFQERERDYRVIITAFCTDMCCHLCRG